MSIWSKNHDELAKLAQTLQDRNVETRRRMARKFLGTWPGDRLGAARSKSDSSLSSTPSPRHQELSFDSSCDDPSQPCSRLRVDSFSSGDSAISPDFPRSSYPPSPILKQPRFTVNGNDTPSSSPKNLDKKVTFLLGDEICNVRESFSVKGDLDNRVSLKSLHNGNGAQTYQRNGDIFDSQATLNEKRGNGEIGSHAENGIREVMCSEIPIITNREPGGSHVENGIGEVMCSESPIMTNGETGRQSMRTVQNDVMNCARRDENGGAQDSFTNNCIDVNNSSHCERSSSLERNHHRDKINLSTDQILPRDLPLTNEISMRDSGIQGVSLRATNESDHVVVRSENDNIRASHSSEDNNKNLENIISSPDCRRHFHNGNSHAQHNEMISNVGDHEKDLGNSTKHEHVEVSFTPPLIDEKDDEETGTMNSSSTLNISEDLNLLLISLLTNHKKEQILERNGRHERSDSFECNDEKPDIISISNEVLGPEKNVEVHQSYENLQLLSNTIETKTPNENKILNEENIGTSTDTVCFNAVTDSSPYSLSAISQVSRVSSDTLSPNSSVSVAHSGNLSDPTHNYNEIDNSFSYPFSSSKYLQSASFDPTSSISVAASENIEHKAFYSFMPSMKASSSTSVYSIAPTTLSALSFPSSKLGTTCAPPCTVLETTASTSVILHPSPSQETYAITQDYPPYRQSPLFNTKPTVISQDPIPFFPVPLHTNQLTQPLLNNAAPTNPPNVPFFQPHVLPQLSNSVPMISCLSSIPADPSLHASRGFTSVSPIHNEAYHIRGNHHAARPNPQSVIIPNKPVQNIINGNGDIIAIGDHLLSSNTFPHRPHPTNNSPSGMVTNTLNPTTHVFHRQTTPILFLPPQNSSPTTVVTLPGQDSASTSHLYESVSFGNTSINNNQMGIPLIIHPLSNTERGQEEISNPNSVVWDGIHHWNPNSSFDVTSIPREGKGFAVENYHIMNSFGFNQPQKDMGFRDSLVMNQSHKNHSGTHVNGVIHPQNMPEHIHISHKDSVLSFSHPPETTSQMFQRENKVQNRALDRTENDQVLLKCNGSPNNIVTLDQSVVNTPQISQLDVGSQTQSNNVKASNPDLGRTEYHDENRNESETCSVLSDQSSQVESVESVLNDGDGKCLFDENHENGVESENSVTKNDAKEYQNLKDGVAQTEPSPNKDTSHLCSHCAFPGNIDIHVHPTINIPSVKQNDQSLSRSTNIDEGRSSKIAHRKRSESFKRSFSHKHDRHADATSTNSNDADDSSIVSSAVDDNMTIDSKTSYSTSTLNSKHKSHREIDSRYLLCKIEKMFSQFVFEPLNSLQKNGMVTFDKNIEKEGHNPPSSKRDKGTKQSSSFGATTVSSSTSTKSLSRSKKSEISTVTQHSVIDLDKFDSDTAVLMNTLKILQNLTSTNDTMVEKRRNGLKPKDCQRLLQILNHFENKLSSKELKIVKEDLHELARNLKKQLKSNKMAVREEIENRNKLFTSERFTMGKLTDLTREIVNTESESNRSSLTSGKNDRERRHKNKGEIFGGSKSRETSSCSSKGHKRRGRNHSSDVSNGINSPYEDFYLRGLNRADANNLLKSSRPAKLFHKQTELLHAHRKDPSPPLIISNVQHLGITFPQSYSVGQQLDQKHSLAQMILFLSEENLTSPMISRNVCLNPVKPDHIISVSEKAMDSGNQNVETAFADGNKMTQSGSHHTFDSNDSQQINGNKTFPLPNNASNKSSTDEQTRDSHTIPYDSNICDKDEDGCNLDSKNNEYKKDNENNQFATTLKQNEITNNVHVEIQNGNTNNSITDQNSLSVTPQSLLTTPEAKPRSFTFSDLNSAFSPIRPVLESNSEEHSLACGDEIAGDTSQNESDVTEAESVAVGMEIDSQNVFQMDREFDKYLAEMKPYVLKLPHKSERQKCAVWIKKLCEPPGSSASARRTRNLHAQLMLQMLKKGSLSSPFDQRPADGPLQPLPSYVSIYFDDPLTSFSSQAERIPDWVEGELGDTIGSNAFPRSLGNPAATSTWVSGIGDLTESPFLSSRHYSRPHSSMGHTLDKDPSLSPIRNPDIGRTKGYSADDMSLEVKRSPSPPRHRPTKSLPSPDRKERQLPDVKVKASRDDGTRQHQEVHHMHHNNADWNKPYNNMSMASTVSLPKGTTFYEDTNTYHKPADREVAVRTKMIEAKFHEEKLKLQQKHDAAVQKILDRKNAEIEDVKSHYRSKSKDTEEANSKLDKKVQTLLKEVEYVTQNKDKQIGELKKMSEDSNEARRNEFEKRLNDVMAEFEQEKFEMQKQHTQNIQEILDDTNSRLQRMEAEYSHQTTTTTNVIKELESRVQHLMTEVDSTLNQRSAVEKERNEALSRLEKLNEDHERLKDRSAQMERQHQVATETQEHNLRSLKNKTEASLEFLKQENSMAASKAADTIKELEDKVDQLKKAIKETEEQKHRQIRELEQVHQQDKLHLENLHDKQVRNMKKEMEQQDSDWNKKMAKMEKTVKEREEDITKLKEQKQQQSVQSEQALEEFKLQVEKNQARIYDEMKQQMDQVESDLSKSKQAREKQAKEFARQMEEMNFKQQHEIAELKMNAETEKSQLMREFHVQKEFIISEHEKEVDNLKEVQRAEVQALEARLKERQEKADKTCLDSERVVRELREELVQANQLRKQQLVELGLLREEEKQKVHRDHEAELAKQRTELEQQRLELQKSHSVEMEAVLEKTNERLKSIEKEYADRGAKSSESIAELQNVVLQLRGDIKKSRENSDEKLAELKHQYEEEKQNLRKQYSHNLSTIQKEVEANRNRCRNLERQLQTEESDHEEKLTQLQLHCEERVRGLISADLKQELESTITSLKAQVSSLQQRSLMLQEELDAKNRSSLGPFGSRTSSPIKSSV